MCRLAVAANRKPGGIVPTIGPIEWLFIVIIILVFLGILLAVLRALRRR
jgi:hypothetical protein